MMLIMKKLCLFVLCVVALGCGRVYANIDKVILPDKIYVFTQTSCPHCSAAKNYIKGKYPDLEILWQDISISQNRQRLFACAAKFKLDKSELSTPLFCMGNNYIMGWGSHERDQFKEYVEAFLPEE